MTPTRSTELHQRRLRLTREPIAAAEARSQVGAVIRAWKVPVDPDIAVLLTSDLVTDAITHGEGETVTLAIRCSRGHLRIDVYDTSRSLPMTRDEPAGTETGHGLVLVAALSTEWGSFQTPAGKATYFTLAVSRPDEAATVLAKRHQPVKGQRGKHYARGPRERPSSGFYWIKSSLSYANGNCVEVASLPGGEIGVRNSRDSAGPVLRFTPDKWHAFLGGVRNGEFGSFGS